MNTQEIIKKIIEKSISSVICIDDQFALPYEEKNDSYSTELSKDLYLSLTERYKCTVDMVRFNENCDICDYNLKFARKDLVVLDWELSSGSPEFLPTLQCMKEIMNSEIPFVCIYTNEVDYQQIYQQIFYYFSGLSKENSKKLSDLIEEYAFDENPELNEIKDLICDWSEQVNSDLLEKIKPELKKLIGKWKENHGLDICKELGNMSLEKGMHLFNIVQKKYLLPDEKIGDINVVKIEDANHNIGALNINGKVLIVLNKREKNTEKSVSPEQLLDKYACFLAEEPNNLFNVIWLHYKNKLNHIIFKQGEFFQDISQDAFLYQKELLEAEGESLDSFIKMLYQDELVCKLKLADDLYEQGIADILESKTFNIEAEDLVKLNYYYSINRNLEESSAKVVFGDIFEDACTYYLCITALCDCLRPEEKIHCNYCFVEGQKVPSKTALEKAETGFYSFIRNPKGKHVSIEWSTHKLFTLYIPNDNGNKANMNVTVRGKQRKLRFVCNQKENYTQRVANDTFSWANRVGITYARLKEDIEEKAAAGNKEIGDVAATKEQV